MQQRFQEEAQVVTAQPVRETARNCLPLLKANAGNIASDLTLLRASANAEAGTESLLRASAGATSSTHPEQLLRGTAANDDTTSVS